MGFTEEEDRKSEWKAFVDSLLLLQEEIYRKDWNKARKRIDYIMQEMVKG